MTKPCPVARVRAAIERKIGLKDLRYTIDTEYGPNDGEHLRCVVDEGFVTFHFSPALYERLDVAHNETLRPTYEYIAQHLGIAMT